MKHNIVHVRRIFEERKKKTRNQRVGFFLVDYFRFRIYRCPLRTIDVEKRGSCARASRRHVVERFETIKLSQRSTMPGGRIELSWRARGYNFIPPGGSRATERRTRANASTGRGAPPSRTVPFAACGFARTFFLFVNDKRESLQVGGLLLSCVHA